MPFIDTETGEVYSESCPACEKTRADCDSIMAANERDQRVWKLRATRAENALEAQRTARQDKATWVAVLDEWLAVFPDVPKPRSISVKSARAQEVFARLNNGASVEDVLDAIHGAKVYPYLNFGERAANCAAQGKRAVDLSDICAVKGQKADKNFDLLAAEGRKRRA